jgi:prephenate dehydrogenase
MGRVSQPPFGHVAIYGLGLIGGSIGLAIKGRWPAVRVTAVDRPPVVDAAIAMRVADDGGHDLRAAAGAALIVLAAPVLQNVLALRRLPDFVDQPVVVTDVGSTKRVIQEAAGSLPGHVEFIGGHPLAGAAVSGIEAARPDLFADRPWILTGSERVRADVADRLRLFVTGLGAIPRDMDPVEHDRVLAFVSHLPQLAVSALMHVVGCRAGADGLTLAGRGLRDTTRLASSPAATWRDIAGSNADNIAAAIDDLIAALEQLRPVDGNVPVQFDDLFVSAARWKGVLEHS